MIDKPLLKAPVMHPQKTKQYNYQDTVVNLISLEGHYLDLVLQESLMGVPDIAQDQEVYKTMRSIMNSGYIQVREFVAIEGDTITICFDGDVNDPTFLERATNAYTIAKKALQGEDGIIYFSAPKTYKYKDIPWFQPLTIEVQLPNIFQDAK